MPLNVPAVMCLKWWDHGFQHRLFLTFALGVGPIVGWRSYRRDSDGSWQGWSRWHGGWAHTADGLRVSAHWSGKTQRVKTFHVKFYNATVAELCEEYGTRPPQLVDVFIQTLRSWQLMLDDDSKDDVSSLGSWDLLALAYPPLIIKDRHRRVISIEMF